jgi:16S rRNA (uracil1498-N3)-methyltransferase
MTRRRWIADEISEERAALTGAHADHLTRVLRARVGQEFDIASDSTVRRGRITSIGEGRVEFELGHEIPVTSAPNIALALSIFKFDRMEWALEKCTELGVSQIVPLVASRTEAHLATAAAKRVERWRRIAREASEQSRRSVPPEIPAPIKLKDALALPASMRIVLSESEKEVMLTDILRPELSDVLLAFGPEGGWTATELTQFCEAGWLSASLGSTVLRAETAAIAAVAVVLSQLQ